MSGEEVGFIRMLPIHPIVKGLRRGIGYMDGGGDSG